MKPCPKCGSTKSFPEMDGATMCPECGECFFWGDDPPEPPQYEPAPGHAVYRTRPEPRRQP